MPQLTSTGEIFKQTQGFIAQSQANLADVQKQISSGKRFDSYDDMVGNVNRLKGLEDAIGRSDSYINSINRVMPRLQIVDVVLDQLVDISTELRNNIALRQTPAGDSLDLNDVSENLLSQVEQLLNTKVDGQYIFSGGANAPPIRDNIEVVANYASSAEDAFATTANYYTGDGTDLSVRISDGREVTYNLKADNQVFQNLISALHLAKEADGTEDAITFAMAVDQINDTIDGLGSLRGQNGNSMSALVNALDSHEQSKLSLSQQISDLTDTDIIEASIEVAFNETILQATFQTFARVQQLKLIDFL